MIYFERTKHSKNRNLLTDHRVKTAVTITVLSVSKYDVPTPFIYYYNIITYLQMSLVV